MKSRGLFSFILLAVLTVVTLGIACGDTQYELDKIDDGNGIT